MGPKLLATRSSLLALAAALVAALLMTASPASAASNKGGKQPPPGAWQCSGRTSFSCSGYQYSCEHLNLGPYFWGFTNSDATEDYYEAFPGWRCYGG